MANDKKSPDDAPDAAASETDEVARKAAELKSAKEAGAAKTAADRRKAREAEMKAKRDKENEKVWVEIVHGQYVDHVSYTTGDGSKPPATVGDFIQVTEREAVRLVRDGVAKRAA